MTISRVERGIATDPYVKTIRKLARVLKVDPGWLRLGDE